MFRFFGFDFIGASFYQKMYFVFNFIAKFLMFLANGFLEEFCVFGLNPLPINCTHSKRFLTNWFRFAIFLFVDLLSLFSDLYIVLYLIVVNSIVILLEFWGWVCYFSYLKSKLKQAIGVSLANFLTIVYNVFNEDMKASLLFSFKMASEAWHVCFLLSPIGKQLVVIQTNYGPDVLSLSIKTWVFL